MSAEQTAPCANGCRTRPNGHGNRRPLMAESPGLLCRFCDDRLRIWLTEVPDSYALLPAVVEPGSVDRDPDSKRGKRAHPPAPLRVEVVDLRDYRRAEEGWRGALGVLARWGLRVRAERNIEVPGRNPLDRTGTTVAREAAFLLRHRLWITEQPWVSEFYDAIGDLHRQLADATGDYRMRPVGTHAQNDDGEACGGPLLPSEDGGVHCPRCGTTWSHERLGLLGRTLQTEGESKP